MKKFLKSKKTWVAAAMALVLAMGGATYAWFTHYAKVDFGDMTMGQVEVLVEKSGFAYIADDGTGALGGGGKEISYWDIYDLNDPDANPLMGEGDSDGAGGYTGTILDPATGYEHKVLRYRIRPGDTLKIGYKIVNQGDAAIVQLPWYTDGLKLSKVNGLDKTDPSFDPVAAGFPWNAKPIQQTADYTFADWKAFDDGSKPYPGNVLELTGTAGIADADIPDGKFNDRIWPDDGIVLAPAQLDPHSFEDENGNTLRFIQYYSAHEDRYLDILSDLQPDSVLGADDHSLWDYDLNAALYRDSYDGRFYAKMLPGDEITVVFDLNFDEYLNNSFQWAELSWDESAMYAKAVQLTSGDSGDPEAFADFFRFYFRDAIGGPVVDLDDPAKQHELIWFGGADYFNYFTDWDFN